MPMPRSPACAPTSKGAPPATKTTAACWPFSTTSSARSTRAAETRGGRVLREDGAVPGTFKLVVLASGSGTNLQAILDTLHGREGIEVVGVGTDKPDAWALERAQVEGVATAVFAADKYEDRAARDADMAEWIESRGADWSCWPVHAAAQRRLRRPLPQPRR